MSIFNLDLDWESFNEDVQSFFKKHLDKIILSIILLIIFIFSFVYVEHHRDSKMRNFNQQIFNALELKDNNVIIENLQKIYNDQKIPRISKTFAGLKLATRLFNSGEINKAIEINEEIFNNEKNNAFKYLAAYNIIVWKNNETVINKEYLINLFNKLKVKENPFLDLLKEQEAIFYIRLNETNTAKKILNGLLNNKNLDNNFEKRIQDYLIFIE